MANPTDTFSGLVAFDDDTGPFSALMQQAHAGVAQSDMEGRFTRVNRRWADMLGYSEAELLGMSVHDVSHPESAQLTKESMARVRGGESHFVMEKRYVRKDGSFFWGSVTAGPLRDEKGALRGYVALVVDLTPQRRHKRVVEGQNEALQRIISGAPLEEIFNQLIAVVEENADGAAVASVLLFDEASGRLFHGAAPSLPASYNAAVSGIAADPNVGTCAAAAALNEVVVTPDIAAAPSWRCLKELPLALGLRAAWSMPILSSEGRVLGTFGTYFRQPRTPTAEERETVALLTKTAALAIERERARSHLDVATSETERQRRLYETILSNTPDFVYFFDLQHRFTYFNDALLKMWGKTWDEAIGKTCLELGYEPWHADMHNREIDQVAATKQQIRGTVAFNGTYGRRFYDYIFVPVIGASGEVEAVAGTTRDVTETHKLATATRFINDLSQALATMTSEQEIIRHTVSAVGRHIGAHRCYFVECLESENFIRVGENWVGDDAPSLAGEMTLYDFGGPEWWNEYSKGNYAVEDTENDPLISPAAAANYASAGIRSYAVQPLKRSGDWTIVLGVTDKQPRKWTADELSLMENVIARVWPMVERVRSEAALRIASDEAQAASRAKDHFLAVLSHELRTPLNPVLLLASEAAANQKLPAEVRADFETIAHNVSLEARLIDDLLDLTRIVHNKLPLTLKPHDVHSLLRQVIGGIQKELKEKKLSLVTCFDAPVSVVNGDEVRLQQIFWNLLKNAMKFTGPAGRITVRTRIAADKADMLGIEITDTGIGLTPEELNKVFNPFAQGEHSVAGGASQYGGLGLGLPISRRVAELHAGSLTAQSPGRNQGATFLVELPLASSGSDLAAANYPRKLGGLSPVGAGVFRRVLLIEDHEPSRIALGRLLANRQIEVVHASSAAEALAKAEGLAIDLVISDIGLPDMNGYDLMSALRTRLSCPGIALSGYGTEEDVAKSLRAGFKIHLTKPVQAQALEKALEQVARSLEESRAGS